jgi:hypothetical protein
VADSTAAEEAQHAAADVRATASVDGVASSEDDGSASSSSSSDGSRLRNGGAEDWRME